MSPRQGKGSNRDGKHYWLTPPRMMKELNEEFGFDFDACPYPRPEGFDGLEADWGDSTYVNPPFSGPTGWARKAIAENAKGKTVVMVFPTDKWIHYLLQAGAELRSYGDIRWCAIEDGEPGKGIGRYTMAFILRNKKHKEEKKNMKLEIALLTGPETKAFLAQLTTQIDRLEKLAKLPVEEHEEAEVVDEEEDSEDEFSAKPAKKESAKKKAAASFDDDDDGDEDKAEVEKEEEDTEEEGNGETEVDEDEDAEEELPVKKNKAAAVAKAAKAPKLGECLDAARELAQHIGGKKGRETVLGLMKKHFDIETTSELKPEQYQKFVDVMRKALK